MCKGQAREGVLVRPAIDVEATIEHKLEHGQGDDEVQCVSAEIRR